MNPFKLFFKTSYDNATWVRDILDETPINVYGWVTDDYQPFINVTKILIFHFELGHYSIAFNNTVNNPFGQQGLQQLGLCHCTTVEYTQNNPLGQQIELPSTVGLCILFITVGSSSTPDELADGNSVLLY